MPGAPPAGERVTPPELVEAGQRAVDAGEADSVSSWVNAALEERVRRDRKWRALAEAIADFEQEFGEITPKEIAAQKRRARQGATIVRGAKAIETTRP